VADKAKRFEVEALAWIDTVYRVALSLCAQPSLADDLVQATYLKAWERFDQFQAGSNGRAWLLTILRNVWIDHLRRRDNTMALAPNETLDQTPGRPQADEPIRWDQSDRLAEQFDDPKLAAAFMGLPDDFRLALCLVDIEGYSHAEAGELLGVPAGTVKSRTSRGRRMIQERLSRSDQPARVEKADEGQKGVT
jgi:RNA polymerase sigma-70 factor (ECF subfamily)